MMTFDQFEEQIVPAKPDPTLPPSARLLYEACALASEAGEVAGEAKKMIRDHKPDEDMINECGDVLFYMHRLLRLRGCTLEDAAHALLDKLERQRLEAARR